MDEVSAETRWRQLFESEPPRSAGLVAQAVAWREQVLVHGDVAIVVKRDLAVVAEQVRAARVQGTAVVQAQSSALSEPQSVAAAMLPPAAGQLTPGTRLVKSYGGATYVVEVTASGMLYDGDLYASLSAVAKAITGTHWNGLLFFGLRKRKTYPARAVPHG